MKKIILASLKGNKLKSQISDWTKDLAAAKKPTPDFNHKKEYRDYILNKYDEK